MTAQRRGREPALGFEEVLEFAREVTEWRPYNEWRECKKEYQYNTGLRIMPGNPIIFHRAHKYEIRGVKGNLRVDVEGNEVFGGGRENFSITLYRGDETIFSETFSGNMTEYRLLRTLARDKCPSILRRQKAKKWQRNLEARLKMGLPANPKDNRRIEIADVLEFLKNDLGWTGNVYISEEEGKKNLTSYGITKEEGDFSANAYSEKFALNSRLTAFGGTTNKLRVSISYQGEELFEYERWEKNLKSKEDKLLRNRCDSLARKIKKEQEREESTLKKKEEKEAKERKRAQEKKEDERLREIRRLLKEE